MLADEWFPPDHYPGVISVMDDGRVSVYLPDFNVSVVRNERHEIYDAATMAVHRHIRHRRANNHMLPFASAPETIRLDRGDEEVILIPTFGWDIPTMEEQEGDG